MVLAVNGTTPVSAINDDGISISTNEWHITPERAQQLLSEHPYTRQRTLKRRQVHHLTNAMLAGQFLPDAISIARFDGRDILVNGQHRMHALIAAGMSFTFPVTIYHVSTEANLNAVYGRLDRGTARSVADVLTAHDIAAQLGLPTSYINRISAALTIIGTGWAQRSQQLILARNADARIQALCDWQPEINAHYALLGGTQSRVSDDYSRMTLAGVASVALFTLRYGGTFAHDFWQSIASNDGLRKGTTQRTLVDWVDRQRTLRKGGDSGTYIARGCITAWNAAYRSRDLTFIRVTDTTSPVTILGTPMKNGVLLPNGVAQW